MHATIEEIEDFKRRGLAAARDAGVVIDMQEVA
jgi:hypothetical protein